VESDCRCLEQRISGIEETAERRASPKGNAGQTAKARTLRRDIASNALFVVRRAARQSKSVRFKVR
jgi:hypothetical protein